MVRSEKLQNENSPIFFEFSSRILLRIFHEFFDWFSCFVSWETETRKIHQKSPAFFNAKFPGKLEEKIHKSFLESGPSKEWEVGSVVVGAYFWGHPDYLSRGPTTF